MPKRAASPRKIEAEISRQSRRIEPMPALFADDANFQARNKSDLGWKLAYRGFAFLLSASVTLWCLSTDHLMFLPPALIGVAVVCYFILRGD
jgi:hypothetical protein